MSRRKSSMGLVVFLLPLVAHARAADFEKQFQAYEKAKGPGIAIAVLDDRKTIYRKAFGYARLGSAKVRIGPETTFNLASLSKQFTAMAILLLEQDGKVSVDDLLTKHLSGAPPYMHGIKLRHLVHHTSGVPDYMELCEEKEAVGFADILRSLSTKKKLDFPLGSEHRYSNTGYVLLAQVVERVSQKPFGEFLKERIFSKLGMKDTYVYSAETQAQIPHRALGYGPWPYFEEDDKSPCNYILGDGGIYTNTVDYAKWLSALAAPSSLLRPEFLKKYFESGKTDSGTNAEYAYGWMLGERKGQKAILHSGGWLGFRSYVAFFPAKKRWVFFFSNYEGLDLDKTIELVLNEFISPA